MSVRAVAKSLLFADWRSATAENEEEAEAATLQQLCEVTGRFKSRAYGASQLSVWVVSRAKPAKPPTLTTQKRPVCGPV